VSEAWIASPIDRAASEVHEMFGDEGNFADYWLNLQPIDHRGGWRSADLLLKQYARREDREWKPEDEATIALMRHEHEGGGGGGMTGLTPELVRLYNELVRSGQRSLEWQRTTRRR